MLETTLISTIEGWTKWELSILWVFNCVLFPLYLQYCVVDAVKILPSWFGVTELDAATSAEVIETQTPCLSILSPSVVRVFLKLSQYSFPWLPDYQKSKDTNKTLWPNSTWTFFDHCEVTNDVGLQNPTLEQLSHANSLLADTAYRLAFGVFRKPTICSFRNCLVT